MENKTLSNSTVHNLPVDISNLPLYFSTNSDLPGMLIHELIVVLMVAGMGFNGFLIYYLVASRKYRSPVFMLVLFLAITDFNVCLSIACLAGFVWPIYIFPVNTSMVCKLVVYMHNASGSSSPYYLLLFAALRFYQLCFPLKARARVTSTFVRNWCLLIMFAEIAGWSPLLFSYNLLDVNYDNRKSAVCIYTGKLGPLTNIAFLVVNACIPGFSIPVLHLMKYIGVSRRGNSLEVQQERKNTDIRALMIIIVMFYIGWFPMNIYSFSSTYPPNHWPYHNHLFLLLIYTSGINNVLNPVIYCLAANSVRTGIIELLCKKKIGKAT